jgi:leucyl-tRNA synthetase
LLYSRYYTRVLNDMGLISFKEPFTRLLTQGMVCKETVSCPTHGFLLPEEVNQDAGAKLQCVHCGETVIVGRVEKMSKSKKNVVDPNILLERYGADTTRLFCLFAAPPDRDLEWNEQGVEGGYRFVNRLWRLAAAWKDLAGAQKPYSGNPADLTEALRNLYRKIHQTTQKVTRDIEERFHFNTAISAVMELVNMMTGVKTVGADSDTIAMMRLALETVTRLLSPIVPHLCEELWMQLGKSDSVLRSPWPEYDESALEKDELLIVVQVNGKLRGRFAAPVDAAEETLKQMALADPGAQKFIADKDIRKIIVVRKKLVNIVV